MSREYMGRIRIPQRPQCAMCCYLSYWTAAGHTAYSNGTAVYGCRPQSLTFHPGSISPCLALLCSHMSLCSERLNRLLVPVASVD